MAEKGPQTKNELAKYLNIDRKAIYNAINSLQKKRLVEKTKLQKEYRGQKFDRFWLSFDGLIWAIIHGVSADWLKDYAVELWGEQETLNLIFDLAEVLPKDTLARVLSLFRAHREGQLESQIFNVKAPGFTEKEMADITRVVLKYPSFKKMLKNALSTVLKGIEKG